MRKALGFPDELHEEYFLGRPNAVYTNPYRTSTMLFIEFEIATELHMSMREWGSLPSTERRARLYVKILGQRKDRVAQEESRAEAEQEQRWKDSLPKLAGTGVRP